MIKGIDTLQLSTTTDFPIVVEMLEMIFNIKSIPLIREQLPMRHDPRGFRYVLNRSEIALNAFCKIKVTQYTKVDKKGYLRTHIEIYGLSQYSQSSAKHINTYNPIKDKLATFFLIFNPTLYRIDFAVDVTKSFDEVAPLFNHYEKPYKTTYYSHPKKSHANKQFCLYDKSTKNKLQNSVTRLELTRDYSRGRSPIILKTLADLEEYLKETEDITLTELTINNVPTTNSLLLNYCPATTAK